jgi:hypothetical protein
MAGGWTIYYEFNLLITNNADKNLIMQKMKHLFIVLLLSVGANAQTTPEQKMVQQTVENMFATLTNADTTALKKIVTANVRFYEYGQVWTIDTLIQKVMQSKSITDFRRTNKFEFVSTTINNKAAWTTYYLQSEITRNGKQETIRWMETVVLVEEKKQWKIAVLHSTRLVKN